MSNLVKIKQIFLNLIIVYKNFVHWNIHKIIITLFSIFIAIISFLPFFIAILVLGTIDGINWIDIMAGIGDNYITNHLFQAFITSPILLILESLILIIGVIFAIGIYGYRKILLFNLYDKYFIGEKIGIKNNIYFGGLKKYVKLLLFNFLLLSIPIIGFILFFFFIIFIFGGFSSVGPIVESDIINPISISLFIAFSFASVVFIYLYYRLIFSYIIISKKYGEDINTVELVKESLEKTRGLKLVKLFLVLLTFGIIIMPFSFYSSHVETEQGDISKYLYYSVNEEYKELYEIEALNLKYGEYSNGVLIKKLKTYNIINNLLQVFGFLFLYCMFEALLMSFYREELETKIEEKKKSRLGKLLAIIHKK